MKNFILKTKNPLICFTLLFSYIVFGQTIITIDNNVGSTTTYTTIQEAHDNAANGDIIYVQPSGTSYGNVLIDKPITIVGRSHSEPLEVSQLGTVTIRSSNVLLKGLRTGNVNVANGSGTVPPPYAGLEIYECRTNTIDFGQSVAYDDIILRGNVISGTVNIYVNATDVLISNNIIAASTPITSYNSSSCVISNNIFRYWSNPMSFNNLSPGGPLIMFNNMFIFTWSSSNDTSVNLNNGEYTLSNNLTYSYGGGNVLLAGSGITIDTNTLANTDPLFTDVDTSSGFADNTSYNPAARLADDLSLQAGSPALTGGGGGSEMGIFNDGFRYKYLGNPRDVPTLDVISYDGAVPKNGNINVTINAKAH